MSDETKLAVQKNELQEELKKFIFGNYGDKWISEVQMAMAIKLCQEYNLSPLRREIHFLPFKNSKGQADLQPVIAYTEYLKKAQMTGNLNGWKYEIGVSEWDKKDMRCKVTIYRKDREYPLEHTVWFSEVAQKTRDASAQAHKPNKNRKDKPKFMIMKVAIAQWMRLAFPEDLGAMPYEESEAWNVIEWKVEKTTTQDVVEEVDYNNEDQSTIVADPRVTEVQKGVKINKLEKLRIDKMWVNEYELFLTWVNKKYILKSPADLTDEQMKEMADTIKNYDADHLHAFIKNLGTDEVPSEAE